VTEDEGAYRIPKDRLHFLFDSMLALNRPVINEPALKDIFDFDKADRKLVAGELSEFLWGHP
jgi:hypothetical protein